MWLGHHFHGQKVKGRGHQAAVLTAVLARQAAATVSVGTCWSWEAATLPSARPREALRHPREEERVGGHIVAAARLQLVTELLYIHNLTDQFTGWTTILPAVYGYIYTNIHAVRHNDHPSVFWQRWFNWLVTARKCIQYVNKTELICWCWFDYSYPMCKWFLHVFLLHFWFSVEYRSLEVSQGHQTWNH